MYLSRKVCVHKGVHSKGGETGLATPQAGLGWLKEIETKRENIMSFHPKSPFLRRQRTFMIFSMICSHDCFHLFPPVLARPGRGDHPPTHYRCRHATCLLSTSGTGGRWFQPATWQTSWHLLYRWKGFNLIYIVDDRKIGSLSRKWDPWALHVEDSSAGFSYSKN
jgi:hypothetical protein